MTSFSASAGPLIQSRAIRGAGGGPRLLITGGVHGDEYEPMVAIRHLIRLLDPAAIRGEVTLAPVVNDSAYALGQRCAEDGLDLARTCPGRPDGSITERAAHELSRLIQAAEYYIDLHSGGDALSVFPLVGYMLHPDPAVLESQRRMARAFDFPLTWGTSSKLNGRSLSVARDAAAPAIYAEYGGGGGCDPFGVGAYVRGCLNVMRELGILVADLVDGIPMRTEAPHPNPGILPAPTGREDAAGRRARARPDKPLGQAAGEGAADAFPRAGRPSIPRYGLPEAAAADRPQYVVEDWRDDSGHMQIQNPSPAAGYFEPAVLLGSVVRAGQPLGDIVDVLGEIRMPALCREAGLVVVLRARPVVAEGDALAVIVPVEGCESSGG